MRKKHCTFVTVGRAENGKRIRKRIYYDNQSDYNYEYQKLMRQYDGLRNTELLTLGVYIDKFKKAYVSTLAVTTQSSYNYYLGKFKSLYHLRLVNITKTDLQTVINENISHPCACTYMKKAISRVFNCAVDDGYLTLNPAKNLSVPKYKPKERRAFTDVEIKAILSAEYTPMQRLAVMLLYVYGLRPEELRALQPSDFDFKVHTLTISRAVVYSGNVPVIKGTKTGEARVLPIPQALERYLRAQISDSSASWLFHDKEYHVMTKGAYTHFTRLIRDAINRSIGQPDYMQKNGLSLYNFRHTVGVRLYYTSVSNKYSAKFLGHSEDVFVRIYSHIDETKEDIQSVFATLEI